MRPARDPWGLGEVGDPHGRPARRGMSVGGPYTGKSRSPALDRLSCGLVDDASADLDCVIGESLVITAEQRHIDGGGHTMFPFPVHEHREQMPVDVVHVVVIVS